MSMAIMPAVALSLASVVANLATILLNLRSPAIWQDVALSLLQSAANVYLTFLLIGGVALITEWKKIHCSAFKKILYLFTFPLFMLPYIPISVAALFINVEWKPIVHHRCKTLNEIKRDI